MRPTTRRETPHASSMRHFSHAPRRHPQRLALHRSPRHIRRPGASPTILAVTIAQVPRLFLHAIPDPSAQTTAHDFSVHKKQSGRRHAHRLDPPLPATFPPPSTKQRRGRSHQPMCHHPRRPGRPNPLTPARANPRNQYFTLQPYGCVVAFATALPSFTAFNAAAT